MSKGKIILIDDEMDVLLSWSQTLELEGYEVLTFNNPKKSLNELSRDWAGIVLTDVKMPDMSGFNLLDLVQDIDPELPVVLFTGHGDISMAIHAIRNGAYDFVEKTTSPEYLLDVVQRALEKRRLILENRALRQELDGFPNLDARLIGKTEVMEKLKATIRNIANTDVAILLIGETGSGKEQVARSLHDCGVRAENPFVAINCGAMPETIFESELFGYEPGAFTGATKRRIGKIEFSNGGTLFLDEVESMPMQLQVKLLRVLQERVVERIGGNASIEVDIRVIAASKEDLHEACNQNRFRQDLLYRLDVVTIPLPSLRECIADIPLLFEHFVNLACNRHLRPRPRLDPQFLGRLMSYDWPGNVRELNNVAERFVLGIDCDRFDTDLEDYSPPEGMDLHEQVELFEKQIIIQTLKANKGRINQSAKALKISRKTLYLRIRKFGLDKFKFR